MNSSSSNNGESNNEKISSFDCINRDLGLYFLELARLGSSKATTEMEEEDEEAPKKLNTINSSGGFLVATPDKLSVRYTNVSLHGHDVGVVQANKPAPVKCLLYYFEIYVKDAGAKGQIAIGFTNEGFKMRRQPGNTSVIRGVASLTSRLRQKRPEASASCISLCLSPPMRFPQRLARLTSQACLRRTF
ncbi:hypothetical protein V6N12_034480 [Hibiscus sabdariffa]|uniref:Uncharacterized protein n=1 Tax=Hibiscus sabdariffa TaxID=183260 RepID=A0ABR2DH95_9ROSI